MPVALLDDDATLDVRDDELGIEGGDPTTVYTLRVVTPQVVKRLRRAHTKRRPTGGQGMADVLDLDRYAEALWDYVLTGWSGVLFRGAVIGPDDLVQTPDGPVKAKTQLDGARKGALLERSGANAVVEVDRDASFRGAP